MPAKPHRGARFSDTTSSRSSWPASPRSAITTWLVDSPARVPLTVVNNTNYELTIATSKPGTNSWLPLLVINPGEERTVQGAIDPGPEWLFRFAGQGRDGGEIAVTRDELRDAGWRFEVPPAVVAQLEEAGATPPPR